MAKTYSNAGRQANTCVDATTAGRGETRFGTNIHGCVWTCMQTAICFYVYFFNKMYINIYIYTNALFWQIKYLHILTFVLFISEVCDVYAS